MSHTYKSFSPAKPHLAALFHQISSCTAHDRVLASWSSALVLMPSRVRLPPPGRRRRKVYDQTGSIEDSEELAGEKFNELYEYYRSVYAQVRRRWSRWGTGFNAADECQQQAACLGRRGRVFRRASSAECFASGTRAACPMD